MKINEEGEAAGGTTTASLGPAPMVRVGTQAPVRREKPLKKQGKKKVKTFKEYIVTEANEYKIMLKAATKKVKGEDKEEAIKIIDTNFPSYANQLKDDLGLNEAKNPNDGFDNEFSIGNPDAKKLAKNYGQKWEFVSKEVWTMDDAGQHVFTYLPKEGKLFTDFDEAQVIDMVKGR